MTSTIGSATLTVTITEAVTLNGYDQGSSNSLSITGINEVVKRIASITTTETGILGFSNDGISAIDGRQNSYIAGQFDTDNIRYIRVTNKDDTNFVTLVFRSTSGAEFAVKVDKGCSFIYPLDLAGGGDLTMDAHNTAQSHSLENLIDITADADTASCDVEIFVASVC